MATSTTRLGLRKPDPSDNVNVTTDISDNMDRIDDAVGFQVANGSYPSSPYQGKTVFRSDLNDLPAFWTGSRWEPLAHKVQFSYKSTNQSLANQGSLQNITGLSLNLKANTTYWIEAFIVYSSPTDGPNLWMAFNYPGTAFFQWAPFGIDFTVTGDTGIFRVPVVNGSDQMRSVGTASGGSPIAANPKGVLLSGSVDMTLQFRACQQNVSTENTQILAGSFIMAIRV